ncbi:MAG: M23 family metallopeptidase [Muribaculaceae bacterium]|nr:M23 family metallopeptidase [Muribaculaceae bacterium]
MSHKAFYRYNPANDRYERVYPSGRERMIAAVRQAGVGIAVAIATFALAYIFFESPRERKLREKSEQIEDRLATLNRRADQALEVMEDLAQRDNNFYRVMMQAEPITAGQRYAGLERQRNYEAIDSMADSKILRLTTDKLDLLDQMLYTQSKSYDFIAGEVQNMTDRTAHIPAIQPISEKYLRAMASGYGYRRDPIYGTTKFHEGMDFSSPIGTPVYATGDGTVTHGSWKSQYGNLIEIDHGYNYTTRYAHLSQILVKPGQKVKRGDLIGKVGNTGKSTGPHLHYEVRFRGQPQNPVNYYFYDLTPEEYDRMIIEAENAGHVMD